jgi:hypothetical protein
VSLEAIGAHSTQRRGHVIFATLCAIFPMVTDDVRTNELGLKIDTDLNSDVLELSLRYIQFRGYLTRTFRHRRVILPKSLSTMCDRNFMLVFP